MAGPGDNLKKDDQYLPYSHADLQWRSADDGNGDIEYIGYAMPGVADAEEGWQIEKFTNTAGSPVAGKFAGGSNRYDKIWDNRAGYSYS
ncbi:hypothetical protein KAR91_56460 [Candidatus Pacearchaeota archaeon]|nr:hypothetical protein [Candidatus Pacearchaeota archaeon]